MVGAGLPEKKVVGEKESRLCNVEDGSMKNKSAFGVPKVAHAVTGEGNVSAKHNHFVEVLAGTAGSDGRLWEHLMKLKAELECLIGLAKSKEVNLEPSKAFCCLVCGFSLVAQQPVKGPFVASTLFVDPGLEVNPKCGGAQQQDGLGHLRVGLGSHVGVPGPSSLFDDGVASEPTSPGL